MGFGQKLRKLRERRDMTQAELGRAVGLQQAQIGHYEAGRREPSIENLRKLCLALHVSADYLLGLESNGYENGFRRGAFEAVEAMKAATRPHRLSVS